MKTYQAQASIIIEAKPDVIYQVIADYRNGHPNILPKKYFTSLSVEQGGIGADTIIRTTMKFMGATQELRLFVTEPVPGKILQEEDPVAQVRTQFKVEPLPDQRRCEVTILTIWNKQPGMNGFVSQLINPPVARSIYRQELALLKGYVEAL
jgi:hypothetical protein